MKDDIAPSDKPKHTTNGEGPIPGFGPWLNGNRAFESWTQSDANCLRQQSKPVCGTPKWKLENGAQRPAPETRPARNEKPKIAGQRLGRAATELSQELMAFWQS
jgi:hypothetical protein